MVGAYSRKKRPAPRRSSPAPATRCTRRRRKETETPNRTVAQTANRSTSDPPRQVQNRSSTTFAVSDRRSLPNGTVAQTANRPTSNSPQQLQNHSPATFVISDPRRLQLSTLDLPTRAAREQGGGHPADNREEPADSNLGSRVHSAPLHDFGGAGEADSSLKHHVVALRKTIDLRMNSLELNMVDLMQEMHLIRRDIVNGSLSGRTDSMQTAGKSRTPRTLKGIMDSVEQSTSLESEVEHHFRLSTFRPALVELFCSVVNNFWKRLRPVDPIHPSHVALATLLYGHQSIQKKGEWAFELPQAHAKFRFLLTLKALKCAQEGALNQARVAQRMQGGRRLSVERSGPSRNLSDPAIEIPTWLRKGFVRKEALMVWRDVIEKGSDNSLQFVKEVHGKEKLYIAKRIYELGMQCLREARSAVRDRFLMDCGFCLVDWEQLEWLPIHQSPVVQFKIPEGSVDAEFVARDAEVGPGEEVDGRNELYLKSLLLSRTEMVVLVEYDVWIQEGQQRAHGRNTSRVPLTADRKRMKRVLNLLEASLNMCIAYTQSQSKHDFIRLDPDTFRVVYRLAAVFRSFVSDMVSDIPIEAQKSCFNDNSAYSQDTREEIFRLSNVAVSLRDFLPGPTRMKQIMEGRILKMNSDAFSTICAQEENCGYTQDWDRRFGNDVEDGHAMDCEELDEFDIDDIIAISHDV